MNQHQIKQEAGFRGSLDLDTLLSEDWDSLDEAYGTNADKGRNAVSGLVVELRQRGGTA